ncbi:peptidoglycan-binding domain-containing protein [Aeromicrobium sp.]|uniref:peptidoglycan-binding domain-containing protein n=1 Tax=Aeromicrobium sp. TaxID=1871063 RepID=UPI003D6A9F5D
MSRRTKDSGPPRHEATERADAPPAVPEDPEIPELDPGYSDTWLFVVAGLLGIVTVLLVGAAFVVTRSTGTESPAPETAAEKTAAPETTAPEAAAQPAAPKPKTAGPLANLECDDTFIVEIARSDPPFGKSTVQDAVRRTDGAKYLKADASCSTYAAAGKSLVAYVGPFDTLAEACKARRETQTVTSAPHRMNADQIGRSYCHCEIDPPTLQLSDGTDGDVTTLMAVAEVQQMLKVLGYFEPPVEGLPYGPRTSTGVREFQLRVGLPTNGNVNRATWKAFGEVKFKGGRTFCQDAGGPA